MKTRKVQKMGLCILIGILTFTVVKAQPTSSATTPPSRAAASVLSVFSDAYTNIQGVNYRPDWGQPTAVTTIQIGTDNILEYSNLTYEGTEFPEQTVSDMTHLHIDVWSAEAMTVNIYPIDKVSGEQGHPLALAANSWTSFDIPLTVFTNMSTLYAVWQFKIDGGNGKTIYIDNLYFYDNSFTTDTELPSALSATVGNVAYNSIELKLKANDNSGAVIFTVSYGEHSLEIGGQSGVERSYTIADLEENAQYSFTVSAKDRSNNSVAENKTVTATTAGGYAKPLEAASAPSHSSANVMSIYSNTYSSVAAYVIGGWGQTTTVSDYLIGDNNMMKLENFNYLGLEINNNNPIDYSTMTKLHVDVWTPNATGFQITPIGGGETLIACEPLLTEKWNSFDIPLSNFTSVNPSSIIQIKMLASGENAIAYIDNIYFYKEDAAGIDNNSQNDIKFFVNDNNILQIQKIDINQQIRIYTVQGKEIYNQHAFDNNFSIKLEKGMYIVCVDDFVEKIIIK